MPLDPENIGFLTIAWGASFMARVVSFRLLVLAGTVLLAVTTARAQTPAALQASEQALYAGKFDAAVAPLSAALAGTDAPDDRMQLLLQQMRVHQTQRLSGKISPDEASVAAAVKALAPRIQDPALLGLIGLRETTSDYFERLTTDRTSDVMSLQPAYRIAAQRLTNPCLKAEAQFFVGLMPQIGGDIATSGPPLAEALRIATAGHCDLEVSYVLRHQAAEREAAGDKVRARDLMAESLAIRQRIGFQVFVPYSLLSLADAEQALGETQAARAHRQEALDLARKLDLPAQESGARQALGEKAS
jgi:tetratricopeptide (TPR) repeat protein